MEIVYTRPTLTLSKEEYAAFETVRSVLYELSIDTPYKTIEEVFANLDDNDEVDFRKLGKRIDDFFELTVDFIAFINEYGKVIKKED